MPLYAFRKQLDRVLHPFVSTCARVPLSANTWTLLGTLVGVATAAAFFRGLWILGCVLFVVRGLFDLVDGHVARARNQASIFGAVMDDVADRWVLGVIYAGASLELARGYPHLVVVMALGITGALTNVIIKTSITAQAPGDQIVEGAKVLHPADRSGSFGSAEFVIALGVPILLMVLLDEPVLGAAGVWAVAILSHVSVLQRTVFAWRRYAPHGGRAALVGPRADTAPAAPDAPSSSAARR